ncbi:MAG: phosphate acyltransferase PlsX [Balneola sp.]|jgi:glycerol-3-phosphate acyltransferase PlsX|nr:phosphate acyltransferase PlsX [Balneola sp.]MBE79720.1 phosphate acyltransferase PlsX [Balneola sp.]HBX66881.1 phosphate acyltransferase PlsX [Balneolaceae bacterium]|tara:strand:+ start:302 stop:1285 length:984 start_codon:yes stop_codon:yes gene_type:complete
MIVAVDAAGGDYYPKNPVEGALQAVEENESLTVLLVGPEAEIMKELANHEYDEQRVLVHNAPQVIGMEESPAQAVKSKQQSSIVVGIGLHKAGKCDAFVSAGNTGALLAASMFILGKLKGVLRPTIASYFPTIKGFRLLVDAGANLEIKPETAVQFSKMAKIYCEQILSISDPKVGLLNVGEEEGKGTDLLKEIHTELKNHKNFIGNVEGKDILPGNADVYLCDGLVGNIVLKFGESIPEIVQQMIGGAIKEMGLSKEEAGQIQKVLHTALSSFNYENVGGIPFLGVNGVSIVGHGGSSPLAIKNMIKSAVQTVEQDVNGKIVASLN